MDVQDVQIGRVLKSYALEGLVGSGGFGAVYRARQAVVEREVAIKIIWPAFANHPNFIRRFEAEAQLVAGLEHPYIVPLYDYWRDPDGAYIVMRYVRNGHLRQHMTGEPWPLRDLNRFLTQVSSALALAHRYGVVHRDIKPENILIDEELNAYLADFGIAQIVSKGGDADEFSGMASPAYAAPEQITGGIVSSQGDIYSLGIILYELLTGTHPFPELEEMTGTELSDMRAKTRIPSLHLTRPDLPAALDEVLQRATAINPLHRYPDALSFAAAFQQATGQGTRLFSTITNLDDDLEAVIPNPYKGLRAFQEGDARDFFGREALVRRLLNRLKEGTEYPRFLAVVGPSGSGKSSVIKAGLIPVLRQGAFPGSEQWFYSEFVPGAQPFDELENTLLSLAAELPAALRTELRQTQQGFHHALNAILPADESELVLFIDQFEELFTLASEEVADQFLDALFYAITASDSRLRIIITIRADFYDRPLLHPLLSDLVRERTEVVVPLSMQELERVIVEPARQVGVTFDAALVAAIVAEVKEQPGSLPLLQYALSELFDARHGTHITQETYQELGGVRGALARRAEEIYQGLNEEQREAVKQLFLRLITLGEGTEDTRRRALLSEVTSLRDQTHTQSDDTTLMRGVIDALGRSRLLTFDRDPTTRSPTIEITHEAIIREWGRLKGWLDETRSDVRMQRTLAALAADWVNGNRDVTLLMRGSRLESYEKWAQVTPLILTGLEREFIARSTAERHSRESEEQTRRNYQARLERQSLDRLRVLVIVLLFAFAGAVLLMGFAFNEQDKANMARSTSDANEQVSRSLALEASARRALSDGDGDLAVVLAIAANEVPTAPIQAFRTLAEVVLSPGTRLLIPGQDSFAKAVDVRPDGALIASGGSDAVVHVWDAATGREVRQLTGHTGDIEAIAFSPDGTKIVSGAADFSAILWDTRTGSELLRFKGHRLPLREVLFSPNSRMILTASSDAELVVWDVQTGEELHRLLGHGTAILSADIHPDSTAAASGGRDGTVLLWNLTTGEQIGQLENMSGSVNALAFSPSGQLLATGTGDGRLIIWDWQERTPLFQFTSGQTEVRDLIWSTDSTVLYVATIEGTIQVWNIEARQELNPLSGHDEAVTSLAISRDGQILVSASEDLTVREWNVGQPGQTDRDVTHTDRVTQLMYRDDGQVLYSTSTDGTFMARDISGQYTTLYSQPGQGLMTFTISPDQSKAMVGVRDGRMFEMTLSDGSIGKEFQAHGAAVLGLRYLPDGSQIISAGEDGLISAWDTTTWKETTRYAAHDGPVYTIALSKDGSQLVSGGRDGKVIVWDRAAGTARLTLTGHSAAVYAVAISNDEARLFTAGRDKQIIVWDLTTGAELARLTGETQIVRAMVISPDGGTLYAATSDGYVVLWDLGAYIERQRYNLGKTDIFALTLTPVGRTMVAGLDNGQVTFWRSFTLESLLGWAKQNRYIRDVTCFEVSLYRLEGEACATPVADS